MIKIGSRLLQKTTALTNAARFGYHTMSPQDYLINQRDATLAKVVHEAKLLPLPNSNHSEGTTDEIILHGVPYGKTVEKPWDNPFQSALVANHPDLVFLQINPEPYIARQRFLAHKCALNEVEDYDVRGVTSIDPTIPDTWEECVINLVTLDMLEKNEVHTKLFYPDGFTTYSYPYLQDDETRKQLTTPFINSITKNIVNEHFSQYYMLNQILYTALMGKQKVMLAEMPETLLRRKIGNSLTIGELRDLFKFVVTKMQEVNQPMTIRDATMQFLPHVFQAPRDLYLTAMLKEAFQAATCITAFVGMPHFNPIQRYWEPAPAGINYSEAVRINERIKGESDAEQIEKQAIMDVMLDTRAWGKKYITNPFPYLISDVTQVKEEDLKAMKKTFLLNIKKYESFKKKSIKELEGGSKLYLSPTITKKPEAEAPKVKLTV